MLNQENIDVNLFVSKYDAIILSANNLMNTESILELLKNNRKLENEYQELFQKNTTANNKIKELQNIIAKLQNRAKQPKFNNDEKSKDRLSECRSNTEEARGHISKDAELKNSKKNKGKYGNKSFDIQNEVVIYPDNIPNDAIFKGYKDYYIQDVTITPHNTKVKRAIYRLASGKMLIAKLPKEYQHGHYGAILKSLVLYQYHKMRSTIGLITNSLKDMGIYISKTQVHNIIQKGSLSYQEEYNQILATGIELSNYIQTDDTVGKHKNNHHYSTYIGNEVFAYFKSNYQKNRVNFLDILNNDNIEYCFTERSIEYLEKYNIEEAEYLKEETRSFYTREDLYKFLEELQINYSYLIPYATFRKIEEAALIGSLDTKGINDLIVMSDEAGQFDVFHRILCWVHMERNIKKLASSIDSFQVELDDALNQLWTIYKLLKDYKLNTAHSDQKLKEKIINKFNQLTCQSFAYDALNQQIKKLKKHETQLLPSLYNKQLPLHNNRGENSIREYVMRRNISGSTQSEDGKQVRDIMTSILVTCRLCGISMWQLIQDRLQNIHKIPPLNEIVKNNLIDKGFYKRNI